MTAIILGILGLVLGSFVNALVWRIREQSLIVNSKKQKAKSDLSIVSGRSMCPNCRHELAPKDLIPLFSWLTLRGKCRYCHKPISIQYPLVEFITAVLLVGSYLYWPLTFNSQGKALFCFWVIFLTGFVALAVYDLKWFLLPDRIVYPLFYLAIAQTLLIIVVFGGGLQEISQALFGLAIGGGIFYVIYQVSSGKWIGGGDVKLGALLGIIVGGPGNSLLMLFSASLLGTLVAVPLLLAGKAKRSTHLPFGPFLIAGAIIVYLFGASIIMWYRRQFLIY